MIHDTLKRKLKQRKIIQNTDMNKLLNNETIKNQLYELWCDEYNLKFGQYLKQYYYTLINDCSEFNILDHKYSEEFYDLFYDLIIHHIKKEYSKDDILI